MTTQHIPTAQDLENSLRQAWPVRFLEVIDESSAHIGHSGANGHGYGSHFRVRVSAEILDSISRVAQHRHIYAALQQHIDAGVHALAIEVLPSTIAP